MEARQNETPNAGAQWAWPGAWPRVSSQTLRLNLKPTSNLSSDQHALNVFLRYAVFFIVGSSKNIIFVLLKIT